MARTIIFSSASLLAGLLVVAGCQSKPKGDPAPAGVPMTAADIESLRAEYQRTDPGVRVALVTEVLPAGEGDYLRAAATDAGDFPVGSAVTIVDRDSNPLAFGTVVRAGSGHLDATFKPSGKRRPTAGDAVAKFTMPTK